MKTHARIVITTALVGMGCLGWALAVAQPPAGRDGPPPPPGRGDPIRAALDVNGDHQLDEEEIKNASANLSKADRNGDGRIDHEEFRPPMPPMPGGEGGFRRPPPPRDGGFGGPAGDGPPPGGPGVDGGPPRNGPPPSDDGRRPDAPPREGPPSRRGPPFGDRGPPPAGGPSPEGFVERAMRFDADGDGKLDRTELETFASQMFARPGGGPQGRGPAPGEGRPPEAGGDRPERPRRPAD